MSSNKRFFLIVKLLTNILFCLVLFGFSVIHIACNTDEANKDTSLFMEILNGQIEVDVKLIDDSGSTSATPYGSGTISFDYSGDMEGTFSVTGALDSLQTDKDGVLAILNVFKDDDDITTDEFLSLIGYHPTGDGKANVLLLNQKNDWPLTSIEPGFSYVIGTGAPFNCAFLIGLDITEFWAGEKNFIEIADKAFAISTGLLNVTSRDSTHFHGSFLGTTNSGQNALSKHYLLR